MELILLSMIGCPGGSKLKISNGWWRQSLLSDKIEKCESSYSKICKGGIGAQQCEIGYMGPLC